MNRHMPRRVPTCCRHSVCLRLEEKIEQGRGRAPYEDFQNIQDKINFDAIVPSSPNRGPMTIDRTNDPIASENGGRLIEGKAALTFSPHTAPVGAMIK